MVTSAFTAPGAILRMIPGSELRALIFTFLSAITASSVPTRASRDKRVKLRGHRTRSMAVTRTHSRVVVVAALGLGVFSTICHADDPCAAFKWNIAHERAAFAQTPQSLSAASAGAAASPLLPERLYALSLPLQEHLRLAVPLGNKAQFAGAFAGLVRLKVSVTGTYRISLDQAGWIDLLGAAGVVTSSDYAGAAGCRAPHKSVQFNLPSGDYLLQLSGVSTGGAQLAVTAVQD